MSEIDWSLVAEIFADALEQPISTRIAFIAERCPGRPQVLAAVQRLLDAQPSGESSFLRGLDATSVEAAGQFEQRAAVKRPLLARSGAGLSKHLADPRNERAGGEHVDTSS